MNPLAFQLGGKASLISQGLEIVLTGSRKSASQSILRLMFVFFPKRSKNSFRATRPRTKSDTVTRPSGSAAADAAVLALIDAAGGHGIPWAAAAVFPLTPLSARLS